MSIIAEFSIPPNALPGGTILKEMPDVTLELERIVPSNESALPFFWVWGVETRAFIERARDEAEIADVKVLEEVKQGALIRAKWKPEAETIYGIKALRATILEATGTADEWSFRVRAQDREDVLAFQDIFSKQDIPVKLIRIYNLSEHGTGAQHGLTADQRETLVVAFERGYYEKPRRVTQKELGEQFGVTSRAISDRLRRGTANLIANLLETSPTPIDER